MGLDNVDIDAASLSRCDRDESRLEPTLLPLPKHTWHLLLALVRHGLRPTSRYGPVNGPQSFCGH